MDILIILQHPSGLIIDHTRLVRPEAVQTVYEAFETLPVQLSCNLYLTAENFKRISAPGFKKLKITPEGLHHIFHDDIRNHKIAPAYLHCIQLTDYQSLDLSPYHILTRKPALYVILAYASKTWP